jgi:hypothetical protein
MADNTTALCPSCGFETTSSDGWETVDAPPLGALTQCSECRSTDSYTRS